MNGQNDEQVSHQCDHIQEEEQGKKWLLVLWPRGQSQEDELRDTTGLVDSLHNPACANEYGK